MNKLTKALFPLVLAFAATAAMAEDGSDYAMSGVPDAQAPSTVLEVAQQTPRLIKGGHC